MPTINHTQFPSQLRRYRKERGLRQKDVAKLLGIKNTTAISRWEKGENLPSLINAIKLSVVYHVLIDSLFIDLVRELRQEIHTRQRSIHNNTTANDESES